jgi:hypothetical protein
MYPEQPASSAPDNNYDFIMNPQKAPKPKLSGGVAGNPFILKLIFVVGGAVAVMIVVAVAINLFFNKKGNVESLVAITQTEQELVRLSTQGGGATGQTVKNAAINTQLSLRTQQKSWQAFLGKRGRDVPQKELDLKKNETTDKTLRAAKQTSTFDSAYTTIMRSQLETYAGDLKAAYITATTNQEKLLLDTHYQQVGLLLKQWPE